MKLKITRFTLIELLVVITIILILLSILVPTVGLIRRKANDMKCMKTQHDLYMSLVNYSDENKKGQFPHYNIGRIFGATDSTSKRIMNNHASGVREDTKMFYTWMHKTGLDKNNITCPYQVDSNADFETVAMDDSYAADSGASFGISMNVYASVYKPTDEKGIILFTCSNSDGADDFICLPCFGGVSGVNNSSYIAKNAGLEIKKGKGPSKFCFPGSYHRGGDPDVFGHGSVVITLTNGLQRTMPIELVIPLKLTPVGRLPNPLSKGEAGWVPGVGGKSWRYYANLWRDGIKAKELDSGPEGE